MHFEMLSFGSAIFMTKQKENSTLFTNMDFAKLIGGWVLAGRVWEGVEMYLGWGGGIREK